MSIRASAIKASLTVLGSGLLTSIFILAVKDTQLGRDLARLDEETVCRPTSRYNGELQIVRRHKYLPFTKDIVYAGIPLAGLTQREHGSNSLDGVGYVNPQFYPNTGPLAVFRLIQPTHCRVTYYSRLGENTITAPYRHF